MPEGLCSTSSAVSPWQHVSPLAHSLAGFQVTRYRARRTCHTGPPDGLACGRAGYARCAPLPLLAFVLWASLAHLLALLKPNPQSLRPKPAGGLCVRVLCQVGHVVEFPLLGLGEGLFRGVSQSLCH